MEVVPVLPTSEVEQSGATQDDSLSLAERRPR